MSRGITLVLGGLGVKGAANIGTLQSLREHKVKINKIVASGLSSLVGAQFALGKDLEVLTDHFVHFFTGNDRYLWGLEEFGGLTRSNNKRVARGFSHFLRERFFCRASLRQMNILSWDLVDAEFEEFFGGITFSDLTIPLAISTIDINQGTEVLLNQGSLIESLKAGIAYPGLFLPIHIADRDLVSSTLYCELPLESLTKDDSPVIAIDIPSARSTRRPQSVIEIIAQADELRSEAIKRILVDRVDKLFSLKALTGFQLGSYEQIPQLTRRAYAEMNVLLESTTESLQFE